jgi:CheY-like chemotaxis protein
LDLRILVVDDSETTLRLLHVIAGSQQWTICGEAQDGLSGVRQYQHLNPDLVIIDFALPDMNGMETAKRMSALDSSVPLLLFTVLDVEGLQPAAFKAGIWQVVSKFQVLALIRTIESAMARHQSPPPKMAGLSGLIPTTY